MDDCEICFAREATRAEDIDDVETPICDFCAASPVTVEGKHTHLSFLNPLN